MVNLIKASAKRVRIVKPRKVYEILPLHKRRRNGDGSVTYVNQIQPPDEQLPPRGPKQKLVPKVVEHGNMEMKKE